MDMDNPHRRQVPVYEICKILGNDIILTQSWELLAYKLQIPPTTIHQNIKPAFAIDGSPTLGFIKLLTFWISKKGKTTMKNLDDVLRKLEFNNVADKLSIQFSEDQHIAINSEKELKEVEELDDVFDAQDIQTEPCGVKILDFPPMDRKFVIYTRRIMELLDLARDKHVVIISINGRQRSGKSFMLNQFQKFLQFGYNKCEVDWLNTTLKNPFQCGGSKKPITTGIEMLSQPSFLNASGEEIAVYLMDTQGLFDSKTDMNDNILIFAFSLLLSSVTIFNDKIFSEDVLQFLDRFLDYAKFPEHGDGVGQSLRFQKLIFLLRDWAFEEEFKWGFYDDNRCPRGQVLNLKEDVLDFNKSNLSAEAVKTRKGIVSSFEEILFYASPHPNRSSSSLDKDQSQWDENFRNCIAEFVTKTLSENVLANSVKTIGDVKQTGGTLSMYVETWVKLITKSDGLPKFTILQNETKKLHYEVLKSVAIKMYQCDMKKFLSQTLEGVALNNFTEEHDQTTRKCLAWFKQSLKLDGNVSDVRMRYKAELKFALQKEKEIFKQKYDSNCSTHKHQLSDTNHSCWPPLPRLLVELIASTPQRPPL